MTFTILDGIQENKPFDPIEWAQPDPGIPLFLREKPNGNFEVIRICEGQDGKFGIAHGMVLFTGDACSGYRLGISEFTFRAEEYWKTRLLPERYSQFGGAEKRMHELMEMKHSA